MATSIVRCTKVVGFESQYSLPHLLNNFNKPNDK